MPHEITEYEWMEFHEGTADAAVRQRIDAHLAVCEECAGMHAALVQGQARLRREGAQLREALATTDATERMLSDSLARIAAEAPAPRRLASESLLMLQALLEPLFGAGAARIAIDHTLETSAPGGLTAASWRFFVSKLSDAIQPVFGSAAGRLVLSAGAALAVQEG
jgi:hypothetical protein